MADKTYCGNAKEIQTKYGPIIKVGLRASDLPLPNENGFINIVVAPRKEVSEKGSTHSVYVDDWKPQQQEATATKEDLPF